jgi:recombination protein RecA
MAKAKKVLQEGELSEKDKKMKALFDACEKDFGKGTIIRGSSNIEPYGDVIPFSSIALKKATGIGGLPKNKIVELLGWESSGKSTLSMDIIANAQKAFNDDCLLLDKENSFDPFYAQKLGINIDKLSLAYPESLEDAYGFIEKALDSKLFGVIIVDSLTSFETQAKLKGASGMGGESRVNSDKMRRVNSKIRNSNCVVIFINQMREKIGVMFGSPETTSGGNALKFYAHMRIMIRRSEIKADNETNIMTLQIIKNKMAPPMKKAQITIVWGKGFDVDKETIDMAMDYDIITKEGNTYFYEGNKLGVGEGATIKMIMDNPELLEEIKQKVIDFNPAVEDTSVDEEFQQLLEANGETVETLQEEPQIETNDTEDND